MPCQGEPKGIVMRYTKFRTSSLMLGQSCNLTSSLLVFLERRLLMSCELIDIRRRPPSNTWSSWLCLLDSCQSIFPELRAELEAILHGIWRKIWEASHPVYGGPHYG
jgi:hypothetical protein